MPTDTQKQDGNHMMFIIFVILAIVVSLMMYYGGSKRSNKQKMQQIAMEPVNPDLDNVVDAHGAEEEMHLEPEFQQAMPGVPGVSGMPGMPGMNENRGDNIVQQ